MNLFGSDSKLVELVNNLEKYRREAESFKASFEGQDPEMLEEELDEIYEEMDDKIPEEDKKYFGTLMGVEDTRDEIQDIEEGNNYLEKLEKTLEVRGDEVESKEEAIEVIKEGWDQPDRYFEDTSKLLDSWMNFFEEGEEYLNLSVNIFEHFSKLVHEPMDLRMGGGNEEGDLPYFKNNIKERLEEMKGEVTEAEKEYEEMKTS